jgi:hypothetical protein
MKIRNGFVSNSSSSSFCIYGTYVDNKETIDHIDDEPLASDIKKHNLELYCGPWDNGLYVGKSLTSIPDNQTMGDFKKEVSKDLLEVFGENAPIERHSFCEEAWYEG